MGDWKTWGADLRSACKSAQKYGAIEEEDEQYSLGRNTRDAIANWENWFNSLDLKAIMHRQHSYFRVDKGPHDTFDNIRVAMYKNKASVVSGAVWQAEWTTARGGVIPKTSWQKLMGHALKIFGWKTINGEPYLIIQNSYGGDIGDKGLFYFPREVINRDFTFGAFSFVDLTPEQVQYLIKNGKIYENWWTKLWVFIRGLLW
jgi:C1A family cysteine protease